MDAAMRPIMVEEREVGQGHDLALLIHPWAAAVAAVEHRVGENVILELPTDDAKGDKPLHGALSVADDGDGLPIVVHILKHGVVQNIDRLAQFQHRQVVTLAKEYRLSL